MEREIDSFYKEKAVITEDLSRFNDLDKPAKRLLVKFLQAGFTKKELKFSQDDEQIDWNGLAGGMDASLLNKDLINFLASFLTGSRERKFFIEGLFDFGYIEIEDTRALLKSLNKLQRKAQKIESLPRQFKTYSESVLRLNISLDSSSKLLLGSEIIQSEVLFEMFDGDGKRVANFIKDYERGEESFEELFSTLKALSSSENSKLLLRGLKESVFLKNGQGLVLMAENGLEFILGKKRICRLINENLRSSEDWAGRILSFPKLLEAFGTPFITEKLLERKLLEEEARRKHLFGKGRPPREVLGEISALTPEEKFSLIWNLKDGKGARGLAEFKQKIKRTGNISKEQRWLEGIDKIHLKRIKRRENPYHPLNTLGIAKTVGYEIEYQESYIVKELQRKYFSGAVNLVGFKESDGGWESSPGPFYDPLTANLVFGRYVDAGIIDLDTYEGMTMHFNVGLNSKKGLTKIVRSLYLAGAAYDPGHFSNRDRLSIYRNSFDGKKYFECKVFDVMERKDFKWNMRCASHLSWALAAHQERRHKNMPGLEWTRQLSGIWRKYFRTMHKGASSVGLARFISEDSNRLPVVKKVHEELGRIFPDPSSRYRDPNLFESTDLGPVKLSKKVAEEAGLARTSWPNIVAFSREITELTVQKIEAIADSVEKEVIQDIQRIDLSSGERRAKLIREFLRKYNTNGQKRMNRREMIASYGKVREIFKDFKG